MTADKKQEIIDAVAGIGAHASEFPFPTECEKELLRSLQFLCMAILKILEQS